MNILRKVSRKLKTAYLMNFAQIHPAPVLVLGHQKAGTTVIASLLAKISGNSVTIDLFHQLKLVDTPFREQLFSQEFVFSEFVEKHRFYFSTDIIKDPNFMLFYQELKDYFPQGKFIFVIRDPRDNIRSILNRIKIAGNLSDLEEPDQEKLRQMKGSGWRLLIEGRLPDVEGNTYIEKMAHRWNLATDIYLANQDNIVLSRYEDFLKDKIGTISHWAQQVGLEPIKDISSEVNIQYQPKGDRNISWLDFFGEDNLHKIESICGDRLEKFGYK